MSSNSFIKVAEEEGEEPIELPTEETDSSLLISTLAAQFPGACGLKYRNPESRAWRGVRLSDGRLFPPSDTGWGGHVYISVMPKGMLPIFDGFLKFSRFWEPTLTADFLTCGVNVKNLEMVILMEI